MSQSPQNLIEQFFATSISKMSCHMRYAGQFVNHPENLAEHSFYVSMYADLLAEDIASKHPQLNIDRYRVVKLALYHDFDETWTGDIITPVKYKKQSFKEEFDKLSKQMLEEGLAEDFIGNEHIATNILSAHSDYEGNKQDIECRIIKFADQLQSLIYVIREMNVGNAYIAPIATTLTETFESSYGDHEIFKEYVPYIREAVEKNDANKACRRPHE